MLNTESKSQIHRNQTEFYMKLKWFEHRGINWNMLNTYNKLQRKAIYKLTQF